MYLILFLIVFFFWIGLAYSFDKIARKRGSFLGCNTYNVGYWVSIIFTGLYFFGILLVNLTIYSDQRVYYNNLQNEIENRQIFENKMNNMTQQYKDILIKEYPNFEKSIFESMNPDDVSKLTQLLTVYPQLKSSVTMNSYTDNIKELNDSIYSTDIKIRKIVKDIRWNFNNPWIITLFLPQVPNHLTNYINNNLFIPSSEKSSQLDIVSPPPAFFP